MGCGSGALTFLCLSVGARKVLSSDICEIALKCINQNTLNLNLSEKVTIIKSDLFKDIPEEKFDLIIFNPPLIHIEPTTVSNNTVYNTIAIDKNGQVLNKFAENALSYLKENGRLLFLISNIGNKNVIEAITSQLSMYGKIDVVSASFRNSGNQWRFLVSFMKT